MTKLRISVVSYLNAEPFYQGLISHGNSFLISEDIPSVCADKLLAGEADLGLVPVAMFPLLKERGGEIVSDYCIAADGKVASVMLFSEVPVNAVKRIALDAESRTSVTLMRLLAANYFNISPEWVRESEDTAVSGTEARVLIGDRALRARGKYRYETDLAESWKNYTGLPFVFACWVAMRKLSADEKESLNDCFEKGLALRKEIAAKYQQQFSHIDLNEYLFSNIRYELSPEMRRGLDKFLAFLSQPENQSLLPFSRS